MKDLNLDLFSFTLDHSDPFSDFLVDVLIYEIVYDRNNHEFILGIIEAMEERSISSQMWRCFTDTKLDRDRGSLC